MGKQEKFDVLLLLLHSVGSLHLGSDDLCVLLLHELGYVLLDLFGLVGAMYD